MPGDSITGVNGRSVKGLPLNDIINTIKGPEGSEVELTVDRDGKEMTFKLKRAALTVASVNASIVGDHTGYIAVKTFGEKTAVEFREALDGLADQKITGLVVDLRDNPGGYLDSAVEMAELFVKPGNLIVKTIYNDQSADEYIAEKNDQKVDFPVVVLVNGFSASASEVFAGALQDNGAARLVGENTFGKGVVQKVIPLNEGGALKLTMAEYTTPSGRHLNRTGIKPDYTVITGDLQLPFARLVLEPGLQRVVRITPGSSEALVDGEKINMGKAATARDGTVYLPLRFVFEAMGGQVSWDGESGNITVKKGENSLLLLSGGQPLLNGNKIASGQNIVVEDDVSFVSMELLRAFGFSCTFDGKEVVLENK
jgi:carboxyl-terminal processing protease